MTTTITLGGRAFRIAPLTMAAMQNAMPAFMHIGIETPAGMQAYTTVIHAAIAAADPNITYDEVLAVAGVTVQELVGARDAIAQMLGMIQRKDPAPGEGEPPEAAPAAN